MDATNSSLTVSEIFRPKWRGWYWIAFANPWRFRRALIRKISTSNQPNRPERSCTDISCLFIFIAVLISWANVARYALSNGNISDLTVPRDMYGQRCGIEYAVRTKPFLYYFDPECSHRIEPLWGCPSTRICVENCPNQTYQYDNRRCNCGGDFNHHNRMKKCYYYQDAYKIQYCSDLVHAFDAGRCARKYEKSQPIRNRCVPVNKKVHDGFIGVDAKVYDDASKSWPTVVVILMLSIAPCMILVAVMRWLVKPVVWLSIFTLIVLAAYGSYYCFGEYNRLGAPRSPQPTDSTQMNKSIVGWIQIIKNSVKTWMLLGLLSSGTCVYISYFAIALRKRIMTVTLLLKESSNAITSIWPAVLLAIFSWIVCISLISFTVDIAWNLKSIADLPKSVTERMYTEPDCTCSGPAKQYIKDNQPCDPVLFAKHCSKYYNEQCLRANCRFKGMNERPVTNHSLMLLNAFGLVWILLFISATIRTAVASTISTWYWTSDKNHFPVFSLVAAIGQTFRYHSGTMALGSLTIGIWSYLRWILVVLEFFDMWSSHLMEKLSLTQFVVSPFRWLILLNEVCFRCLNHSAYITCATHGKSLLPSAQLAVDLLTRNPLLVVALNRVTDFILLAVKLMVTANVGATAYWYFTMNRSYYDLYYVATPVTIVLIGTYWIADICFDVYKNAVDTIFFCFLDDCERNDGTETKPYFMSQELMQMIGERKVKQQVDEQQVAEQDKDKLSGNASEEDENVG